jgi:hypothetical protein
MMVSIRQKSSSSPRIQRITEILNYEEYRISETHKRLIYFKLANWGSAILFPHYSNIPPFHNVLSLARAGLHTDAADIMAEVESFGKGSQLLVTSEMIKVLRPFLDRSCGADR